MATRGKKTTLESKKRPSTPFRQDARAEVSAEEVQKLVAEAAYFRAKQRGFAPGHELDDWVAAEAEVTRRLQGRP